MAWKTLLALVTVFSLALSPVHRTHAEEESGKKKKSEKVDALKEAAFQAALKGTQVERNAILEEASSAGSKDPLVHWQQGKLKSGKTWISYSDFVEKNAKSKALEEYRERQAVSTPTLESQLSLVRFCQKHKLDQQALAHWSAIIELESNHTEARKQLGYVMVDGEWVTQSRLRELQSFSKNVVKLLPEASSKLTSIASNLQSAKMNKGDAVKQLKESRSVYAIPLWENFLSTANEKGAEVVIETLESMNNPEASLSLARHAIWSPSNDSRSAAIGALKNRDERSFIPAMLSEMQSPWITTRQTFTDGQNRLTYRISSYCEKQDRRSLQVLDSNYFLQGNLDLAAFDVQLQSQIEGALIEIGRISDNIAIENKNRTISNVLSKVTGETEGKSPNDWWKWWDEREEVYSPGEKPLETSYASRNSNVVGGVTRLGEPQQRYECLAAGTPILTNRGHVAVEKIRIGDLVASQHPVTGEVKMQPVLRTTTRTPERLLQITMESDSASSSPIRATGGHPFWVIGRGWLRARELKPGMRIHGLDHFSIIASVVEEEKESPTFNLIVHEFHSYFVGNDGILSHDNTHIQPVSNLIPGMIDALESE